MTDTAVPVVDMMNTYQHPDAEELTPNVEKIMEPLADLVRRARETDGIDLVYVNDNYGDFNRSVFRHRALRVRRGTAGSGQADRAV